MAISAKELAEKLNISAATVSMVLNNKPGISERTRNLVLNAAKEYGYDFSKKPEHDVNKGNIQFVIYKKHGAIVTDTPFFSKVTEGIDLGCKEAGYGLKISYFYENEDIKEQLKSLAGCGCPGILLLGTEMEEADFKPFSSLPIPLVVLDTYFENTSQDTVLINNVQGAYLAASYLIQQGHEKIGYLRSSTPIGNFMERADGYYKALRCHGISTSHPYVCQLPPSMEGAYTAMAQYLEGNPSLADAYFADNDLIAAGAIRAFKEKGISLPEDISIIGFDNMPICEFLEPALTTMNVPKQKLGMLAVERLISRINHPQQDYVKIEVGTRLVCRSSVKDK